MQVHRITDTDGITLQHAQGPAGNDYTLCGLTLDGDPDLVQHQEIVPGKIDCPDCLATIRHCRALMDPNGSDGVKTAIQRERSLIAKWLFVVSPTIHQAYLHEFPVEKGPFG